MMLANQTGNHRTAIDLSAGGSHSIHQKALNDLTCQSNIRQALLVSNPYAAECDRRLVRGCVP